MIEIITHIFRTITDSELLIFSSMIFVAIVVLSIRSVVVRRLEIAREEKLLQMAIEKERNHAIIEHLKTARSLNRRASDGDFAKDIERRPRQTRESDKPTESK